MQQLLQTGLLEVKCKLESCFFWKNKQKIQFQKKKKKGKVSISGYPNEASIQSSSFETLLETENRSQIK